jgi:glycerol-3-phosphate dehydrogenase subunit C
MEMNVQARHQLYRRRRIPWRNYLLARPELLGRWGSPLAPLANGLLGSRTVRLLLERLLGIHRAAPLPRFSFVTFRGWYGAFHRERRLRSAKRVAYFYGCAANYYEPHVAQATLAVLEHNGYEVLLPAQSCCGLPLLSNGDFEAARRSAHHNLAALVEYARAGYAIVGSSTSCMLALKSDYRHILGVDAPAARLVAEQSYDLCEFLGELAEAGELKTDFSPIPATLPYHTPCQLRLHRMGLPALDLLALIPGLTLRQVQAACCGIAGTYGYKQEKYEIGLAVGRPLFAQVCGARLALCDSETCRWQIGHATGVKVAHPVEVLAQAYGVGPAVVRCDSGG